MPIPVYDAHQKNLIGDFYLLIFCIFCLEYYAESGILLHSLLSWSRCYVCTSKIGENGIQILDLWLFFIN